MPQMEKFGKASATTTVTSAPGSSSRARKAALIPASLPPIMTRCMTSFPSTWGEVGIQGPDHHHRQRAADDLGGDERRDRRGGDAGEGVREHPSDGDRRVGEAGRGGEEVRRPDVGADRRCGGSGPPGPGCRKVPKLNPMGANNMDREMAG